MKSKSGTLRVKNQARAAGAELAAAKASTMVAQAVVTVCEGVAQAVGEGRAEGTVVGVESLAAAAVESVIHPVADS